MQLLYLGQRGLKRLVRRAQSRVRRHQSFLAFTQRAIRFIAAKYDLTFPIDLSRQVINEVRRFGIELDVVWLPCGHYTTAEMPWKAIDAWKIATFMRKHL